MLFTVFGAVAGSRDTSIVPHDVWSVHRYVFFVSMLIAGGFKYFPLNRPTTVEALGVTAPQAAGATDGDGVGDVAGVEPPVSTTAATVPPSASTTASTTVMAMIRFLRWRRRSAWRLAACLESCRCLLLLGTAS